MLVRWFITFLIALFMTVPARVPSFLPYIQQEGWCCVLLLESYAWQRLHDETNDGDL